MFDSVKPDNVAVLLGSHGATKMTLGPGLTRDIWDSIFGPGTGDAIGERQGRSLSPKDGWTRQGWYRKCIDIRAKAASTMPWAIYKAGVDNDAKPLWKNDDVTVPEALQVLSGLKAALYLSEASLASVGAFYFGKLMEGQGARLPGSTLGRFRGLMYWSPLYVRPELSSQGVTRFKRLLGGQEVPVDPAAVVWGWQPDPFVELGPGASDGGAAGANAAALDSLARFLARHLDSGLVKMTVLSVEGATTPEQRSDLRSLWARILRRGTSDDAGPPVLHGTKVVPHTIGDGLKDLGSKEITEDQRRAVSNAFGIPWAKIAGSSSTQAEALVHERSFITDTVIPQCEIIEAAFNSRLFAEYGYTFRFEPHRHEVMQQFELMKAEALSKIGDILTLNEKRELMGYEPLDAPEANGVRPQPAQVGGDGVPMRSTRGISVQPSETLADRIARIVGEGR